jgi:hypothetical protein
MASDPQHRGEKTFAAASGGGVRCGDTSTVWDYSPKSNTYKVMLMVVNKHFLLIWPQPLPCVSTKKLRVAVVLLMCPQSHSRSILK